MNGFFYIDNISKQQCGPFPISQLKSKNIAPETMVWCSGMTDWTEAGNVKELESLFNPNIPAPTEPPAPKTQYINDTTIGGDSSNRNMYNSNVYGRNDVRPMPKNWLVESILVTVCCCIPFGIAAIINATKVESLYYAGDYEGAVQAAKDAKKWTLIGFCSVAVIFILYIFMFFIFGFIGAAF